ncbi:MAG: YccF domain-containing protein [Chloroflexota bacterium]|nr:YccF domain-containing protein [Chloroflexota bacterium]
MSTPIVVQQGSPNILLRFLYFIFIGWWLGLIVSVFAWAVNLTVIGLPLGLYLINRLPTMMTLRPQNQWRLEGDVLIQGAKQHPFILRALYFLLIGFWFSGIWMAVAYVCLLTIIGLPIAFWMYGRIGAVTTLRRQ